ncbi:hypothetical protein PsYK624_000790 [Phanerochaete sordida]|uniref:Uncharacterized protein n=1 Tax=Phanerochaete sordida TaxID=48140 RepID=A0A9P3FX63_9APHY|nr:hypothetical protein PsYK624_000790 [Phanerochaete sordida]
MHLRVQAFFSILLIAVALTAALPVAQLTERSAPDSAARDMLEGRASLPTGLQVHMYRYRLIGLRSL